MAGANLSAGSAVRAELIVLILALLLVVAAFNISSLSNRARSVLILLALVAGILVWLIHQGMMGIKPPG
jgi:hypothetical protein